MKSNPDDIEKINRSFGIGAANATGQSQNSTRDDEFVAMGTITAIPSHAKIAEPPATSRKPH